MADKRNASNYAEAVAALNLNTQEKALYQHHLANLNGPGGVDNADGTRSTIFNATIEHDGKAYVIPTVWGGKILSPDDAWQHVSKIGLDKFPSYSSVDEAEARYDEIHKFMEQDQPTTMGAGRIQKMAADQRNNIIGDQSNSIIGDY